MKKRGNLRAYGLVIISLTDDTIWKEAGRIKGKHAISLADAFTAATAKIKREKLVVGSDEDFKKVGIQLIKVR